MKMSDVFKLPVTDLSLAYNTAFSASKSNADVLGTVAHAVNCHDDLVAALEIALDVMMFVDGANDCSRAINAVEAALAKACGEA